MRPLKRMLARLKNFVMLSRGDERLREEIAEHLAMLTEENVRAGMTPKEARRQAAIKFGATEAVRESCHAERGLPRIETVLQDLRYALRMLRRSFGFSAVAVFALALGIGINTAAFTAYKAFFKRPLDARNSGQMVNTAVIVKSGETMPYFSYPDYEAYRDNLHSFSGLIAWEGIERFRLSGVGTAQKNRENATGTLVGRLGLLPATLGDAEFVTTFVVSENYFSVLGAAPIRGRLFRADDAAPEVLISANFWQQRFGGDAQILGKTIRLNGVPFAVVGVTPRDFVGTSVAVPDFFVPMSAEPLIHPGDNWLRNRDDLCCRIYGRLAPGVTMEQAQAEMNALAEHLRTLHDPPSERAKTAKIVVWPGSPFPYPLKNYGGLRYAVFLIMAGVGMVLVVACANVASLQLAQAASRHNELSIRLALGANRGRIIRQLLTESALLGLIAGAVALLFSWAILQALVVMAANAFPPGYGTFIFHVTPDPGVFAYVFGVSLVAGILFGLAPALESSRAVTSSAPKEGAGTAPVRSRRMRSTLIAGQVAISLMLMIAGGMLIRSSMRALDMDTGYDSKHTVQLAPQFPESYTAARRLAISTALRARLAALPGVAAIAQGRAPDGDGMRIAAVAVDGAQPSARNTRAVLFYTYVEPDYFKTLGIQLLSGRTFHAQAGQPEPAVVVSESAAQLLWPGENPMGRSLRLGTEGQYHEKNEIVPDGPVYQVIGVARDTRGVLLDGSDAEQIYVPMAEASMGSYPMVVRTAGDPHQVMNEAGAAISGVDPDLVATSATLDELLRETPAFGASSLAAIFASMIGVLGLLLASMGIYSTVSYLAVIRTREMGIRLALGASRRSVLALMLRESLRPVIAGVGAGICLAIGISYLLRGVLYGMKSVDGIAIVAVSAMFLAIALLAAYFPSRRATRINPMQALREE